MSNADTNINIRVTSSADTAGIDAANKALDEMTGKQQGAADSARIDEIVSPAAVETVTATTEAFGELEDQTRDLDARLQQAARSYMATGTSAERAMGTIVLSYDRTASAAKTAQAAVYSLQQALSEVSSTGTIGLGVSPETVKTVDETTAAYEELLQRVAELEQQLQQQAKAHKTTRAAAEQSAGGIVGAYRRVKGAVTGAQRALQGIMWWPMAINQSLELLGRVLKMIVGNRQAAADAIKRQSDADQAALERLKELRQAVFNAAAARRQAEKDSQQSNVNRSYEERINLIRQAMELEAIAYEIEAKKSNDEYAVRQAQLQRDLATQKITQAQFDEKARALELEHNESIRKISEEAEKTKVEGAQKTEKTKQEQYDAEVARLRKIKELAGTIYHDYNILGSKFSVGVDPVRPTLLNPEKYKLAKEGDDIGGLFAHREALLKGGYVNENDPNPNKWDAGTEQAEKDKNAAVAAVIKSQSELKTSTGDLTIAQANYAKILEFNQSERDKEEKETIAQREGRTAEQSRAAEQQASAARIGAAQATVDQLQRTAEQQQQAAKAQQEAIDKMIKDTSDKDFQTFLDRMATTIAQQSNEGGYRDRLQQALEMFKGYASANPEQLAGKMDEMTKVFERVTLPYSMMGSQDVASLGKVMEALLAKANLGTQMRSTATQQQAAGNNLTEVRDAETSITSANEHEQTQRAAVSAVATAARALRERITDPQQQADLDTIIEVMHDGQVAADETSILVNAFGSLADANREAADSLVSGLTTAVKSGEGFLAFAREMLGKTAEGAAASQRQEEEITALRGSIANIKWSSGTLP